jgi:hypothetical protein
MRVLLVVPAVLRDRRSVGTVEKIVRRIGETAGLTPVAVLQARDARLLQAARRGLRGCPVRILSARRPLGKWGAVLRAAERLAGSYDHLAVVDGDGAFMAADGLRLVLATVGRRVTHGIGARVRATLRAPGGGPSPERLWVERYLNALLLRQLGRARDRRLANVDVQCGLVVISAKRLADLRRAARTPYGGELVLFAATVRRGEAPASVPVRTGRQLPSTLDLDTIARGAMAIPLLAHASDKALRQAIDDAASLYRLGMRPQRWLRTTFYPMLQRTRR